jgi:hypothetical protein
MSKVPSKFKVEGHIDSKGEGEIEILDEETRKRAIECIQSRGRIKVTSTNVEGQGVVTSRWEQKVD